MKSEEVERYLTQVKNIQELIRIRLLPAVDQVLKKYYQVLRRESFKADFDTDLYSELKQVIGLVLDIDENNILRILERKYFPVLLSKTNQSKYVAILWKLIQLKVQIITEYDECIPKLNELEEHLTYLQDNQHGAVIGAFQDRSKKKEYRLHEKEVEDKLAYLDYLTNQTAVWQEQLLGKVAIKNKIKKNDSFYIYEIYKIQSKNPEKAFKKDDLVNKSIKSYTQTIADIVSTGSYEVYHAQMLTLWTKLKKSQAQKDRASFSISLLANGRDNFPNISAIVKDDITLEQLTKLSAEQIKERYTLSLNDASQVLAAAKNENKHIYDNAIPKFNAEYIDSEKLRFLSLLRFCSKYSKSEIAKQKEASSLIQQINSLYETVTSIAINNLHANFLDKGQYIKWSQSRKELFQGFSKLIKLDLYNLPAPESNLAAVKEDFVQNGAIYFALIDRLSGIENSNITAKLPRAIVKQVKKFHLITANLKVKMRPYQEFGVKYILSFKNVLLGDEMGLGKTIQSIATINHLSQLGDKYAIVVCPLSIIENWRVEIGKWSELDSFIYHGVNKDKELNTWLDKGGVLLTNFEQCQNLFNSGSIKDLSILIVDEAHYIKNAATKRAKGVKALGTLAENKLYMSGTPLENNLSEMRKLIADLNPKVAEKINKLVGSDLSSIISKEVYEDMIATVYLRRKRKDVLKELPKLSIIERWSRFNKAEENFYLSCADYGLGGLSMMRRAAFIDDASEKINQIKEITNEARASHRKVVIFSYFKTAVLFKLVNILPTCMNQVLSGDLSVKQRQELVDEFNKSTKYNVLLSQIEAGGVGLNIQSANIVIICEPQWKPSTENQAISRVYRMGQSKDVIVYRLLTRESLDDLINELIFSKQEIFDKYANDSVIDRAFIKQQKELMIKNEKHLKSNIFEIELQRIKKTKKQFIDKDSLNL